MTVSFCGLDLAHRVINGSGTFDAIAARKAFGAALEAEFPFAAYVSKTITLQPRSGNPRRGTVQQRGRSHTLAQHPPQLRTPLRVRPRARLRSRCRPRPPRV